MTGELRGEMKRILKDSFDFTGAFEIDEAIDRILDIPEIREALAVDATMPSSDYRDYLLRRGRWEGRSEKAGYV